MVTQAQCVAIYVALLAAILMILRFSVVSSIVNPVLVQSTFVPLVANPDKFLLSLSVFDTTDEYVVICF